MVPAVDRPLDDGPSRTSTSRWMGTWPSGNSSAMTVRVAPAAPPMPRARCPAWRPITVTKNHLPVVAASFIRFRTSSMPRSTAVVKPKVGMSGGRGRSLSMVLGTWTTATRPSRARRDLGGGEGGVVAADGEQIGDVEPAQRFDDLLEGLRARVGLAREVRRMEPPSKWIWESPVDVQLLHSGEVAVHEPLVAVLAAEDAQATVARLDGRRGDDRIDAGRRAATHEDRQRLHRRRVTVNVRARALELGRVAAGAGGAVAPGAVVERLLARGDPAWVALPGLERRRLQRAAVGEAELPRVRLRHGVHGVQVRGGHLVALAAGEEHDAGHRGGHGAPEAADGGLGDLLDAGLPGALLPESTMLGLSSMPSRATRWRWSASKTACERRLGDLVAALDGVVAVHEHLGLDDRDEARLLAERGVAREGVGVGVDAVRGRDAGPMVMTARHLAKRAPRSRYSARRSRGRRGPR